MTKLTKAQIETLARVRDTRHAYNGIYRHNVRQWESWQRLVNLGLLGRGLRTVTAKGKRALKTAGI